MTLQGYVFLPLLLISFSFPRLERMSQKLDLHFNNHMREGERYPP
jgi:hypothetical protein